MKLNSSTSIIGEKVILVPYKKKHVPKYNNWMQREDLQEATASAPLDEEAEYVMQQTWLIDEDKCTFIVLDKEIMDKKNDEIEAMIGDANLYINAVNGIKTAECGIMIAEDQERGKGKGLEALALLLKYGCDCLNINEFEAKIGTKNLPSINLFKKMKFELVEENEVFSEVTYSVQVNDEWKNWLNELTAGYHISNYEE